LTDTFLRNILRVTMQSESTTEEIVTLMKEMRLKRIYKNLKMVCQKRLY